MNNLMVPCHFHFIWTLILHPGVAVHVKLCRNTLSNNIKCVLVFKYKTNYWKCFFHFSTSPFFLTFHVISPLITPFLFLIHFNQPSAFCFFFFLCLFFSPVPMELRARLSRLSPTWTPWRSPSSRPVARWKVCVVRSVDRARWVWLRFSEDSWMSRQHVIYYIVQICAKEKGFRCLYY